MSGSNSPLAVLLWPGLFYAGLAAVGIPILIHLLSKRRFKRVRWAAIEFLLLAERQNRRRINIQQLILLTLRCLAIFLLGLMLARPYFSPGELADVLGAAGPAHRIIILDDSFSMGYTQGAANAFEQARAAASELLAWSYVDSPASRVSLLRTSDPAGRILDGVVLTESLLGETQSLIKQMTCSEAAPSLAELAAALRTELSADPDQISVAIYVISDFQKRDWLAMRSESDLNTPLAAFRDWPEQRGLSITLVAVGEGERPNAAITQITQRQPQMVANLENRLSAVVANYGSEPQAPREMSVFLNSAAQSSVRVPEIQSGESIEIGFNVTFPTEGSATVTVELPPDALGLDDRRIAVVEVQPAIRVLILNGEYGGGLLMDEAGLLQTALQPGGETVSGFQVVVVQKSELDNLELEPFHLLILTNVDSLNEEVVGKIESHVRNGGGLAVFLGDQVDADFYGIQLWQEGHGLLPCRLGSRVNTAEPVKPPGLVDADPTHPVTRVLSGLENPAESSLVFRQYYECIPSDPDERQEADPERGGRVLARFADAERRPAILEKPFGRGKVLLFASSADTEWNNWAQWPSYVIAVQELGQYLARPASVPGEVLVGRTIRHSFAATFYQPEVVVRPSTYPSDPETLIRAEATPEGTYHVVWPNTSHAGVYHLLLNRMEGKVDDLFVAVNPDSTESDLESSTEAELRQSAAGVELTYVTSVSALAGSQEQARREIWPVLLLTIVSLLMVEQLLACRFGRTS